MKFSLITLLTFLCLLSGCSANSPENSPEDKICHCIQENFKLAELDYFKIMDEVEADLIKNKIIDQNPESRLQQLQVVSQSGQIGVKRTYESVIFEQIGIKTVKYCVNLISYSSSADEISGAFRMFQELDILAVEHSQNLNLINLRRESAQILLKYNDKFKTNSQLWKIIQLEYLYWFSDFQDIKMELLPAYTEREIDSSNLINIQVAANDTIKVDGELVKFEELCAFISSRLNEKIDINLTNKRNTRYKLYIDVFQEIHACFNKKRDEKSMEMFQKNYEDLSKEELEKIDKMMSMRIVEYAPQR